MPRNQSKIDVHEYVFNKDLFSLQSDSSEVDRYTSSADAVSAATKGAFSALDPDFLGRLSRIGEEWPDAVVKLAFARAAVIQQKKVSQVRQEHIETLDQARSALEVKAEHLRKQIEEYEASEAKPLTPEDAMVDSERVQMARVMLEKTQAELSILKSHKRFVDGDNLPVSNRMSTEQAQNCVAAESRAKDVIRSASVSPYKIHVVRQYFLLVCSLLDRATSEADQDALARDFLRNLSTDLLDEGGVPHLVLGSFKDHWTDLSTEHAKLCSLKSFLEKEKRRLKTVMDFQFFEREYESRRGFYDAIYDNGFPKNTVTDRNGKLRASEFSSILFDKDRKFKGPDLGPLSLGSVSYYAMDYIPKMYSNVTSLQQHVLSAKQGLSKFKQSHWWTRLCNFFVFGETNAYKKYKMQYDTLDASIRDAENKLWRLSKLPVDAETSAVFAIAERPIHKTSVSAYDSISHEPKLKDSQPCADTRIPEKLNAYLDTLPDVAISNLTAHQFYSHTKALALRYTEANHSADSDSTRKLFEWLPWVKPLSYHYKTTGFTDAIRSAYDSDHSLLTILALSEGFGLDHSEFMGAALKYCLNKYQGMPDANQNYDALKADILAGLTKEQQKSLIIGLIIQSMKLEDGHFDGTLNSQQRGILLDLCDKLIASYSESNIEDARLLREVIRECSQDLRKDQPLYDFVQEKLLQDFSLTAAQDGLGAHITLKDVPVIQKKPLKVNNHQSLNRHYAAMLEAAEEYDKRIGFFGGGKSARLIVFQGKFKPNYLGSLKDIEFCQVECESVRKSVSQSSGKALRNAIDVFLKDLKALKKQAQKEKSSFALRDERVKVAKQAELNNRRLSQAKKVLEKLTHVDGVEQVNPQTVVHQLVVRKPKGSMVPTDPYDRHDAQKKQNHVDYVNEHRQRDFEESRAVFDAIKRANSDFGSAIAFEKPIDHSDPEKTLLDLDYMGEEVLTTMAFHFCLSARHGRGLHTIFGDNYDDGTRKKYRQTFTGKFGLARLSESLQGLSRFHVDSVSTPVPNFESLRTNGLGSLGVNQASLRQFYNQLSSAKKAEEIQRMIHVAIDSIHTLQELKGTSSEIESTDARLKTWEAALAKFELVQEHLIHIHDERLVPDSEDELEDFEMMDSPIVIKQKQIKALGGSHGLLVQMLNYADLTPEVVQKIRDAALVLADIYENDSEESDLTPAKLWPHESSWHAKDNSKIAISLRELARFVVNPAENDLSPSLEYLVHPACLDINGISAEHGSEFLKARFGLNYLFENYRRPDLIHTESKVNSIKKCFQQLKALNFSFRDKSVPGDQSKSFSDIFKVQATAAYDHMVKLLREANFASAGVEEHLQPNIVSAITRRSSMEFLQSVHQVFKGVCGSFGLNSLSEAMETSGHAAEQESISLSQTLDGVSKEGRESFFRLYSWAAMLEGDQNLKAKISNLAETVLHGCVQKTYNNLVLQGVIPEEIQHDLAKRLLELADGSFDLERKDQLVEKIKAIFPDLSDDAYEAKALQLIDSVSPGGSLPDDIEDKRLRFPQVVSQIHDMLKPTYPVWLKHLSVKRDLQTRFDSLSPDVINSLTNAAVGIEGSGVYETLQSLARIPLTGGKVALNPRQAYDLKSKDLLFYITVFSPENLPDAVESALKQSLVEASQETSYKPAIIAQLYQVLQLALTGDVYGEDFLPTETILNADGEPVKISVDKITFLFADKVAKKDPEVQARLNQVYRQYYGLDHNSDTLGKTLVRGECKALSIDGGINRECTILNEDGEVKNTLGSESSYWHYKYIIAPSTHWDVICAAQVNYIRDLMNTGGDLSKDGKDLLDEPRYSFNEICVNDYSRLESIRRQRGGANPVIHSNGVIHLKDLFTHITRDKIPGTYGELTSGYEPLTSGALNKFGTQSGYPQELDDRLEDFFRDRLSQLYEESKNAEGIFDPKREAIDPVTLAFGVYKARDNTLQEMVQRKIRFLIRAPYDEPAKQLETKKFISWLWSQYPDQNPLQNILQSFVSDDFSSARSGAILTEVRAVPLNPRFWDEFSCYTVQNHWSENADTVFVAFADNESLDEYRFNGLKHLLEDYAAQRQGADPIARGVIDQNFVHEMRKFIRHVDVCGRYPSEIEGIHSESKHRPLFFNARYQEQLDKLIINQLSEDHHNAQGIQGWSAPLELVARHYGSVDCESIDRIRFEKLLSLITNREGANLVFTDEHLSDLMLYLFNNIRETQVEEPRPLHQVFESQGKPLFKSEKYKAASNMLLKCALRMDFSDLEKSCLQSVTGLENLPLPVEGFKKSIQVFAGVCNDDLSLKIEINHRGLEAFSDRISDGFESALIPFKALNFKTHQQHKEYQQFKNYLTSYGFLATSLEDNYSVSNFVSFLRQSLNASQEIFYTTLEEKRKLLELHSRIREKAEEKGVFSNVGLAQLLLNLFENESFFPSDIFTQAGDAYNAVRESFIQKLKTFVDQNKKYGYTLAGDVKGLSAAARGQTEISRERSAEAHRRGEEFHYNGISLSDVQSSGSELLALSTLEYYRAASTFEQKIGCDVKKLERLGIDLSTDYAMSYPDSVSTINQLFASIKSTIESENAHFDGKIFVEGNRGPEINIAAFMDNRFIERLIITRQQLNRQLTFDEGLALDYSQATKIEYGCLNSRIMLLTQLSTFSSSVAQSFLNYVDKPRKKALSTLKQSFNEMLVNKELSLLYYLKSYWEGQDVLDERFERDSHDHYSVMVDQILNFMSFDLADGIAESFKGFITFALEGKLSVSMREVLHEDVFKRYAEKQSIRSDMDTPEQMLRQFEASERMVSQQLLSTFCQSSPKDRTFASSMAYHHSHIFTSEADYSSYIADLNNAHVRFFVDMSYQCVDAWLEKLSASVASKFHLLACSFDKDAPTLVNAIKSLQFGLDRHRRSKLLDKIQKIQDKKFKGRHIRFLSDLFAGLLGAIQAEPLYLTSDASKLPYGYIHDETITVPRQNDLNDTSFVAVSEFASPQKKSSLNMQIFEEYDYSAEAVGEQKSADQSIETIDIHYPIEGGARVSEFENTLICYSSYSVSNLKVISFLDSVKDADLFLIDPLKIEDISRHLASLVKEYDDPSISTELKYDLLACAAFTRSDMGRLFLIGLSQQLDLSLDFEGLYHNLKHFFERHYKVQEYQSKLLQVSEGKITESLDGFDLTEQDISELGVYEVFQMNRAISSIPSHRINTQKNLVQRSLPGVDSSLMGLFQEVMESINRSFDCPASLKDGRPISINMLDHIRLLVSAIMQFDSFKRSSGSESYPAREFSAIISSGDFFANDAIRCSIEKALIFLRGYITQNEVLAVRIYEHIIPLARVFGSPSQKAQLSMCELNFSFLTGSGYFGFKEKYESAKRELGSDFFVTLVSKHMHHSSFASVGDLQDRIRGLSLPSDQSRSFRSELRDIVRSYKQLNIAAMHQDASDSVLKDLDAELLRMRDHIFDGLVNALASSHSVGGLNYDAARSFLVSQVHYFALFSELFSQNDMRKYMDEKFSSVGGFNAASDLFAQVPIAEEAGYPEEHVSVQPSGYESRMVVVNTAPSLSSARSVLSSSVATTQAPSSMAVSTKSIAIQHLGVDYSMIYGRGQCVQSVRSKGSEILNIISLGMYDLALSAFKREDGSSASHCFSQSFLEGIGYRFSSGDTDRSVSDKFISECKEKVKATDAISQRWMIAKIANLALKNLLDVRYQSLFIDMELDLLVKAFEHFKIQRTRSSSIDFPSLPKNDALNAILGDVHVKSFFDEHYDSITSATCRGKCLEWWLSETHGLVPRTLFYEEIFRQLDHCDQDSVPMPYTVLKALLDVDNGIPTTLSIRNAGDLKETFGFGSGYIPADDVVKSSRHSIDQLLGMSVLQKIEGREGYCFHSSIQSMRDLKNALNKVPFCGDFETYLTSMMGVSSPIDVKSESGSASLSVFQERAKVLFTQDVDTLMVSFGMPLDTRKEAKRLMEMRGMITYEDGVTKFCTKNDDTSGYLDSYLSLYYRLGSVGDFILEDSLDGQSAIPFDGNPDDEINIGTESHMLSFKSPSQIAQEWFKPSRHFIDIERNDKGNHYYVTSIQKVRQLVEYRANHLRSSHVFKDCIDDHSRGGKKHASAGAGCGAGASVR